MGLTITLEVNCSMCFPPKKPPLRLDISAPIDLRRKALRELIEKEGWIVEFNGQNIDTYCTKACAA